MLRCHSRCFRTSRVQLAREASKFIGDIVERWLGLIRHSFQSKGEGVSGSPKHRMTWLDHGIRALFRRSQAVGLAPSLLCVIAWVGVGAVVARAGVGALWQYPRFAQAFVIVVAIVVAMGGLVGFWIVAAFIHYWRRGYRVRWLTGNDWIYEERRAGGSVERLPFSREIVGDGYPAPCEVHIPSETRWELQAPQWAHGRRAEILEHIAELFGADIGGRVQFRDPHAADRAGF
jgi:hypothetical protein